MIRLIVVGMFSLGFAACHQAQNTSDVEDSTSFIVNQQGDTLQKVTKSEEEWRAELSSQEFQVLRQAGTERAFTGDLLDIKKEGVYVCGGCQLPLFDSKTKFESGTGWPSFYTSIDPAYVAEKTDLSYGMRRVEVVCGRCDGHLGHVFEDGPAPTGLRYCINSVSLDFVAEKP